MKLQKQPTNYTCLITCFAMFLDLTVEELMAKVGHDGSEILFPDVKNQTKYKGHSMDELIDYCLGVGLPIIQIAAQPMIKHPYLEIQYPVFQDSNFRIQKYLELFDGVLCVKLVNGTYHAVVWVDNKIIDPLTLRELTFDDFEIIYFLLFP